MIYLINLINYYYSIRLDDDGLNLNFIHSLNKYKDLDKSSISHPR